MNNPKFRKIVVYLMLFAMLASSIFVGLTMFL
ncbi:stressosome-associated protein Prli42 [Bacillus coahuilensis]|nr:stressosome-associated protein Prli42 [Bacillus coahuilensis]